MTNFFYTDATGQKRGPVNDQQLRALASQGHIMPQTPLETDTGHMGFASQIQGLFPLAQPMQQVFPLPPKRDFETGDYLWIIFAGYLLDPSNKTKVDSMTPEQKSVLFRWRMAVAAFFLVIALMCFVFVLTISKM